MASHSFVVAVAVVDDQEPLDVTEKVVLVVHMDAVWVVLQLSVGSSEYVS